MTPLLRELRPPRFCCGKQRWRGGWLDECSLREHEQVRQCPSSSALGSGILHYALASKSSVF